MATSGPLSLDGKNNVEAVRIRKPATGTYTLQIVASSVPHGPQPFALEYGGAL